MFEGAGRLRPHYHALLEELAPVSLDELRRRQTEADRAFLTQGITFTVYGDEQGTERIFPFDLLPRIVTAREWETLERGLTQRLTAINLFLKDIYHEGRILAEGIVPRELVYSCRHYRREMRGVRVHRDTYVSVSGTDLVRLEDGQLRRARGQPARAERRLLHAGQPRGHQAGLPEALQPLQRPSDRAATARRCSPRCGRWRRTTASIRPSSC